MFFGGVKDDEYLNDVHVLDTRNWNWCVCGGWWGVRVLGCESFGNLTDLEIFTLGCGGEGGV